MKKYGPTVKKIRLIKGFTRSEVYSGIISRSFAARFELGENNITAQKLFQILDNLSMSPNEFLYIHHGHHQSGHEELHHQLLEAYNVHDLQTMGKIINENKDSSQLSLKSVAAIGQVLMETHNAKTFVVSSVMNNLWDRLLDSKTWTIEEIKIVPILLPIAVNKNRVDLMPQIIDQFETNCKSYISPTNDPFQMTDQLVEMDLSLIQIYLNLEDYQRAQQLITKVTEVNQYQLTWDGRLTQQLIIAIWNLYFGDEKTADQIIQTLTRLENLYTPAIDHNLLAIIRVRQKLAKKYRNTQK